MTEDMDRDRDGDIGEPTPEVIMSLEHALKRGEAERQEILAALRETPTDPRVVAMFREAATRRAIDHNVLRRARTRVRWFALAAGVLLAITAGWMAMREFQPVITENGTTLSGSNDRLTWIAPKGRVKAFDEFRCQPSSDLPSDTTFELVILDLDPNSSTRVPPRALDEPVWKPTAQQSAALPRRLRATMKAISPDGEILSSVVVEAELSD